LNKFKKIADWRLPSADCRGRVRREIQIGNQQSAIGNWQSASSQQSAIGNWQSAMFELAMLACYRVGAVKTPRGETNWQQKI
jgi:hypothetical protein